MSVDHWHELKKLAESLNGKNVANSKLEWCEGDDCNPAFLKLGDLEARFLDPTNTGRVWTEPSVRFARVSRPSHTERWIRPSGVDPETWHFSTEKDRRGRVLWSIAELSGLRTSEQAIIEVEAQLAGTNKKYTETPIKGSVGSIRNPPRIVARG